MRPDGVELLSRWKEVGAWWAGEQQREFAEWRDATGVIRTSSRELPSLDPKPESCPVLRPVKTRDEKVMKASGYYTEKWSAASGKTNVPYAPLHVLSGYSYGRSVLLAKEIPRRAATLGIPAVALVDRFSLTGAVELSKEAKLCGLKPLIGASVELEEGGELVLIAHSKQGYLSLSKLITECHLSEPRLYPLCNWERLESNAEGLLCLTGGDGGPLTRLLLKRQFDDARQLAKRLVKLYGRENVFIEIERSFLPWSISLEKRLTSLAEELNLKCVAGGPVTHPTQEHFPAQDALVCSETLCTVEEIIGRKPPRDPSQKQCIEKPMRAMNTERYLHSPEEMKKLYSDKPELVENTLLVADLCEDDVLPERTQLPKLFKESGSALTQITWAGAEARYKKITPQLKRRIQMELDRIIEMGFSDHFVTAWDFCKWASDQDFQFSGRGSVVDSVVAYCLGFSRIDAHKHNLHFDRFLSVDGSKRPDIDIDFEAKHRDDVRNYIIQKYGKDRVATVAAVGAFNTRGIVREVGKALGLSSEAIGLLSRRLHGSISPNHLENALRSRPELRHTDIDTNRLHWLFKLGEMLTDVPRNIRAHSSGVVVSDRPLWETVPVQWSGGSQFDGENEEHLRIIQWDKRSAKHYFDKFDILCLRGQDVLAGTEDRIRVSDIDFKVDQLPLNDKDTFLAMQSGELVGIPQSASPAMRQAHMRLQTADLHDASLVQAGIRPGVGGAVKINELIARRRGKPYYFDHLDFEKILGHTYGIVIFQEQVDQLLSTFCGYPSGVAEDIREKINESKHIDYGEVMKDELIGRMLDRGYSPEVAQHAFELIAAFRGYGFAQGHALAFAEISIRSIWCQQNFPSQYFAALLDAQPAGYYGPSTIVNEARYRGVKILPVDVNASKERNEPEDVKSEHEPELVVPDGGLRLSFKTVHQLSNQTREAILDLREKGYKSFFDFVKKVRPERDELESLILCGAFDSLEQNRRALLWSIPDAMNFMNEDGGGLGVEMSDPKIDTSIADFSEAEKILNERRILNLDIRKHLMAYERERVAKKGGITTSEARELKDGESAIVVGNPIRLRFPPTASGARVVFFDLEDETGLLNVTCFDKTYQKYGHAFVCYPYVTLLGRGQWRDGCTAFLIEKAFPYNPLIGKASSGVTVPLTVGDFLVG